MMRQKLILLLCWLLVVGCAQKAIVQPSSLKLSDFQKDQTIRNEKTKKFQAKLSLRFESHTEKISGSGRAAGAGLRHTRLELRDPLGRTQYLLTETPENVNIYVPSSKVKYMDKDEGRRYFLRNLSYPLSITDLRQLWMGVIPGNVKYKYMGWDWDTEKEAFKTLASTKDSMIEVYVDGSTSAIKELKVVTPDGTYLVEYKEFDLIESISLGHEIAITLQKTNEQLFVEWDDIKWEFKGAPQSLSQMEVEKGTKTIQLR